MRAHLLLLLLPAALPLAACHDAACPGFTQLPAIEVEVRDTFGIAQAQGALGILTDGAYVDTMHIELTLPDGTPLGLAGAINRRGTYDILIRKTGFLDWTASNVASRSDACGIIPQKVFATLIPVP